MFQIFRRIGFVRRRWIWALLLLGLVVFGGYWMVPWRGAAADLQLVVMRPDGTFAPSFDAAPLLAARAAGADSVPAAHSGVPLVLGVSNSGMRSARPERLVLALPRWYRLTTTASVLRNEIVSDEPLQRYVLEVDFPTVRSGHVPTLLPRLDTLWLEPYVPAYWCTADADSIPSLIPSTPPDTAGVLPVQIFWSFEGAGIEQRQTGLLTVELPGRMFRRSRPADPAESPVNLELPSALRPPMGGLIEGGTRHAECGPPGDPMRVFSALWLTEGGGRLISVQYGGVTRKEYYDLDRDSVFELEMWDPDGDGEMEAWRRISLTIPSYLLPEDPITAAADSARADSLRMAARADSLARVDSIARVARTRGGTIARGATADGSMAGASTGAGAGTLESLGRQLMPGDPSTARRLFVPRPVVRPRPPRVDGLLGTPIGEPAPQEPAPQPAPQEAPPQEPTTPEPDSQLDLIERTLLEAARSQQQRPD